MPDNVIEPLYRHVPGGLGAAARIVIVISVLWSARDGHFRQRLRVAPTVAGPCALPPIGRAGRLERNDLIVGLFGQFQVIVGNRGTIGRSGGDAAMAGGFAQMAEAFMRLIMIYTGGGD